MTITAHLDGFHVVTTRENGRVNVLLTVYSDGNEVPQFRRPVWSADDTPETRQQQVRTKHLVSAIAFYLNTGGALSELREVVESLGQAQFKLDLAGMGLNLIYVQDTDAALPEYLLGDPRDSRFLRVVRPEFSEWLDVADAARWLQEKRESIDVELDADRPEPISTAADL